MRSLFLVGALLAGAASAQTADPADTFISVLDPTGAVAGPFLAVPQGREIFFGFDRESFHEIGITKLAVLAEAAKRGGAGTVAVVGHTDTSGDARANDALAMRRAQAIRRDLIARGIASAAISVASRGQTDLAVQTGDGVREPANRRVVVTLDEAGAFPPPDDLSPMRFRLP
jgi:outer membrane protein OmpA-like peptidoglycan-associated protein